MLTALFELRRALSVLLLPIAFELGQFSTCAPDRELGIASYPPLYFLADPGVVRQDLVYRVQQALVARGFDPGPVDGKSGARTRKAIADFRTWSGKPGDEEITPQLLIELQQWP
jgi:peptidoglycan hydrolase-like protein with peptidoglycan-binding domain